MASSAGKSDRCCQASGGGHGAGGVGDAVGIIGGEAEGVGVGVTLAVCVMLGAGVADGDGEELGEEVGWTTVEQVRNMTDRISQAYRTGAPTQRRRIVAINLPPGWSDSTGPAGGDGASSATNTSDARRHGPSSRRSQAHPWH